MPAQRALLDFPPGTVISYTRTEIPFGAHRPKEETQPRHGKSQGKGMARKPTIKNETILQAAREVFLEHGASASTSMIAQQAGVSEGTIFKRFETKENLFREAMFFQPANIPWLDQLDALSGKGDLAQNLVQIGLLAIEFFRRAVPLMMMTWSNPKFSSTEFFQKAQNAAPIVALNRVKAFFEREQELQRLNPSNPEILARLFLASIGQYAFLEALQHASNTHSLPAEAYIQGVVNILLHGA